MALDRDKLTEQKEDEMKWQEARSLFPDRWVVIEAIESHLEGVEVKLGEIAVLATTTNGHEMMRLYGQWRNKLRGKGRLVLFAHTSQEIPRIKDNRKLSLARYYVPRQQKIKVEVFKAKNGTEDGSWERINY